MFAYKTKIIKATENFKLGVFAATAGIGVVYLINLLASLFGSGGLPIMDPTNASMISVGFSLFVVVIASLNLVMDFDFIEQGVKNGAPKHMEWYGSTLKYSSYWQNLVLESKFSLKAKNVFFLIKIF